MYRVTNFDTKEVEEFEDIEDFLRDKMSRDEIIEWMNQICGSIEIPYLGEMPAGEVLYKLTNGYANSVDWLAIEDDWIESETMFIRDELKYGEVNYGYYLIEEIEEEKEE